MANKRFRSAGAKDAHSPKHDAPQARNPEPKRDAVVDTGSQNSADSGGASSQDPVPGHDASQLGSSQGASMGATEEEPQKEAQRGQNATHPQAGAGSGEHSGQDTHGE